MPSFCSITSALYSLLFSPESDQLYEPYSMHMASSSGSQDTTEDDLSRAPLYMLLAIGMFFSYSIFRAVFLRNSEPEQPVLKSALKPAPHSPHSSTKSRSKNARRNVSWPQGTDKDACTGIKIVSRHIGIDDSALKTTPPVQPLKSCFKQKKRKTARFQAPKKAVHFSDPDKTIADVWYVSRHIELDMPRLFFTYCTQYPLQTAVIREWHLHPDSDSGFLLRTEDKEHQAGLMGKLGMLNTEVVSRSKWAGKAPLMTSYDGPTMLTTWRQIDDELEEERQLYLEWWNKG